MKYADAISVKIFGMLAMGFCSPKSAVTKTGMPLHTHAEEEDFSEYKFPMKITRYTVSYALDWNITATTKLCLKL